MSWRAIYVFNNAGLELFKVVKSVLFFFARSDYHISVSTVIKDRVEKVG